MLAKPVDVDITIRNPRDPNTLSNYHNFVTRHTSVDLVIDFDKRLLKGTVALTFESLINGETDSLILDTRWVPFCMLTLGVFDKIAVSWTSKMSKSEARLSNGTLGSDLNHTAVP